MNLDLDAALELLTHGELELEGRLVDASNATLRAFVTHAGVTARCVYKPVKGERPLWDFPDGTLAGREVAAYLVSEATGWGSVPPTVLRDGPYGPGSCQLWIEAVEPPLVDFAPELPAGWHAIASAEGGLLGHADDPGLARIAAYDGIVNNADRKGGHLLRDADQHVYGIDHGVCFHTEDKLRTVLWGWAGEPLPTEITGVLGHLKVALDRELGSALAAHLTRSEVDAVGSRIDRMLGAGKYPEPSDRWPPLPWPAL
ncbi:phosphatidylinositol kinase [Longispora fulva]|uniref:Putative repeat protein (TIGR03843 family) n=1 Tax=Longispora fulva TaxID=619741 RepID=A0A8J7KZS8_9ACTN|nr:SCO1664 family protein [Longispora fulva]MBG6141602.1 putative repeat protein (TIGR03843 family) [Longispora fulva]GIG59245.1 phosphatidylinositol kinase [Longispora fulva]